MAHTINPEHVELAFSGGALETADGEIRFEVHTVGSVAVSSGRIAASDPLVFPDPEPFLQPVPPGRHPVSLAVARLAGGDERVAFARVELGTGQVASWRMALVAGQDPEALGPDELFGFPVDAGTGCFMDARTGELLNRRMDREKDYFEVFIAEMEKTYRDTWSWADIRPGEDDDGNIIAFSSGFGDGFYASYFGLSADGSVICLVTDFDVLWTDEDEDGADDDAEARRGSRPWWKFW